MPRRPLIALTAATLAALSIGLAACGGSNDSAATPATTTATPPATTAPAATTPAATAPATTPAPAATTVDVTADPNGALAFTEAALTAPAGSVTLKLTNASPVPHNIAVDGNGVDSPASETIQGGASAEITVDLPAGTYKYYCEVPGHRGAGMEGTLTVE